MNELKKLREGVSYVIVGLLWVNFALIVIRNLFREAGADWVMILGTMALLLPATLLWTRDRTGATTRMVTSMANAATVAILVFAFQGSPLQIDLHMYFFASLAICAAWIDWKAIIGYAALVAIHHLLLYVAMPLAVFPGDFRLFACHPACGRPDCAEHSPNRSHIRCGQSLRCLRPGRIGGACCGEASCGYG
ncbi:MAG: hypothetical protein ACJLUP_05735 [Agrobacterium tumefaciens]